MPTGGLRRELASTLSDLESLDRGAARVVRAWEEREEILAVSADGDRRAVSNSSHLQAAPSAFGTHRAPPSWRRPRSCR